VRRVSARWQPHRVTHEPSEARRVRHGPGGSGGRAALRWGCGGTRAGGDGPGHGLPGCGPRGGDRVHGRWPLGRRRLSGRRDSGLARTRSGGGRALVGPSPAGLVETGAATGRMGNRSVRSSRTDLPAPVALQTGTGDFLKTGETPVFIRVPSLQNWSFGESYLLSLACVLTYVYKPHQKPSR